MSKIVQKGIQILNKYFVSFPQPEALRCYGQAFQLDFSSTNPSTSSKKTLRKVYIPENIEQKGLLKQCNNPFSIKYEEKPNRIQVQGSWQAWLVDEKLHKDILQDPLFGSPKHTSDKNRWVYVGKVEPQKTKSYFSQGSGKLEYVHDYGQGHPGKTHNGIFVHDLKLKKTFKVPNQNNYIVASPIFLDNQGKKIMFHAYHRQHFTFGLIHCFNRTSSLYIATQQGEQQFKVQKFSSQTRTNMFPSISKCQNYLAYFSGNGRTHCYYMDITVLKNDGNNWVPYHVIKDFFIGSYNEAEAYFYEIDGKPHFLCQTNQKASNVIYSFDIESKQLKKITNNKDSENYSIISFDNNNNLLALRYSNQNTVNFAYVFLPGEINIIPSDNTADFECESSLDPIPHFVLRKKGSTGQQPLVTFIHGGPHGNADPTLTAFKYLMLESGYTILIPNYSGSSGYGIKHLENALGNIGLKEGGQISQCVKKLVAENKVDPKKVFTYGGSHGGFLGGTIAGKFHQHFAGAVLLNPVLSLPFMLGTSDIPDWIMVQALNKQDVVHHLNEQDFTKLYNLSPISTCPQIPVSVIVGQKDRRVPHESAKIYVAMAKSKGIKAELYAYPESNHRLDDSLQTVIDVLLKSYKFIEEIRSQSQ